MWRSGLVSHGFKALLERIISALGEKESMKGSLLYYFFHCVVIIYLTESCIVHLPMVMVIVMAMAMAMAMAWRNLSHH